MTSISRREFLRLAMAAGITTTGVRGMGRIAEALAATKALPPVIWLAGQACTGCSVSFLNATYPDIAQILTQVVSLKYHMTVMGGTGDVTTQVLTDVIAKKRGEIVLIVEGSVPTASPEYCSIGQKNGKSYALSEAVLDVAKASQAVIAMGTCAAYGGIPAAQGNPTKAVSISTWLKQNNLNVPTINIAGCPPHPDWMVGTIAHYLWYGLPELDGAGRPKIFYPDTHENCERYSYFQAEKFAKDYGEPYCLYNLGCKGPIAQCDVMKRGWNGGVNNCISCGAPCIGCTAPTFPDHDGVGLYEKVALNKLATKIV